MNSKIKTYVWIGAILVIVVGGILWSKALSSGPDVVSKSGIHWHAELKLFVNGVQENIPENTGIPIGTAHPSSMHTHTGEPNIVHMEFPGIVRSKQTRVGDFFQIWRKEFSATNFLGNKAENGKTITMLVNGATSTAFENYEMKDKDIIEIRYE